MRKEIWALLILIVMAVGCKSIEYECGRVIEATNCENVKQSDVNKYYDELSKANWACIEANELEKTRKVANCLEIAKKSYCDAVEKNDMAAVKNILDSCN